MSSHSNSGGTTTKIKPKVTEKNVCKKVPATTAIKQNRVWCLWIGKRRFIMYNMRVLSNTHSVTISSTCSLLNSNGAVPRKDKNKTNNNRKIKGKKWKTVCPFSIVQIHYKKDTTTNGYRTKITFQSVILEFNKNSNSFESINSHSFDWTHTKNNIYQFNSNSHRNKMLLFFDDSFFGRNLLWERHFIQLMHLLFVWWFHYYVGSFFILLHRNQFVTL